jgi:probable HAF family extracellular repeat protein
MQTMKRLWLLMACCLLLATPQKASAEASYQLIPLPGKSSFPTAINNHGLIVGVVLVGDNGRAVLWEKNGATMRELGTLGGSSSGAGDINDDGWVVGFAHDSQGIEQPFAWFNGEMTKLETTLNKGGRALGINIDRYIVGYSYFPPEYSNHLPCLWISPTAEAYQLSPAQGLTYGHANSITHNWRTGNGEIGGVVRGPLTNHHDCAAIYMDKWISLENPWDPNVTRSEIFRYGRSLDGDVLRVGYHSTATEMRAAYWNLAWYEFIPGTASVNPSRAYGVNRKGQIVGEGFNAQDGAHAFLFDFRSKETIDLHKLINDPNWILKSAWGINDNGQIVGWGFFQGVQTGFLLQPRPLNAVVPSLNTLILAD